MIPFSALAALAALQGAAPQTPAQTPPPQAPTSASVVAAPKPAADAVVATIDGKSVTAGEIEAYLWAWKSRDVVNEYATYQIVAAEAAKKGVTATDEEIRSRIDSQLATAKTNLQPGQTMEGLLRDREVDSSRLALSSRTAILLDKLAALDFKASDYVRIDALLFRPVGSAPTATAKATKDAAAAYASLSAGKTWDAVVKASSTPPAGTAQAIPAAWAPISQLPADVQTQIAALKPQGFTKPVQGPNGVQILHVVARGEAAPEAELADLKAQYVNNAKSVLLQRLRTTSKIEFK